MADHAVHIPHTPPDDAKRQSLRRSIVDQAREIGSRGGEISDHEIDELLGEAFKSVRG